MGHVVGPKGQVVIEKQIREQLGVQPGWQTVQLLVDGHVQIHFLPPPHSRSLLGSAKPFIRKTPPPEDEWDDLVAESAAEDWRRRFPEG
jgi:hypothetical protein